MKFKLNLAERLTLLNLIPKENNFSTLRIIRKFTKELGISDGEYKEFDIVQEGEKITWNVERGLKEKEFEIGEVANQLIVTALEKLDTDKKLEQVHFTIYEKFVKTEKE
ncbi:hypothetical protein LCGC14_1728500 [marine sediment metagenome]|uniref:Uncharacterized protein n=1 Tax=marine sediment metagenome TaxID=412755 RepID=A0A0F9HA86_9ZZZZ